MPSPKGGPAQGQTAKPEVKRMLVQGGFTEVSQSLIACSMHVTSIEHEILGVLFNSCYYIVLYACFM